MKKETVIAIFFAIFAAALYAINIPISKILLNYISPTCMAAYLYIGAGLGMGVIFLCTKKKNDQKSLNRKDLPYIIGMIILDSIAPILLMFGLANTTSANASLLNNFEIVATSIIALIVFKEWISFRMWIAIFLIIISSCILSFEDVSSFHFSWGSILVILATISWGLENNCTKKLSSKNTYQIVMIKGIFSGSCSLLISIIMKDYFANIVYIPIVLLLGFVAYGLSIMFYIKAQYQIGASKTSSYYAFAPFIGAILSFIILHEKLKSNYFIALVVMLIGTIIVIYDTMLSVKSEKTKGVG